MSTKTKTRKPTKEELAKWNAHLEKLDDEKYPQIVELVKNWHDVSISVAALQRNIRVGYKSGERLIQRLLEDGLVQAVDNGTYVRYMIVR